MANRSNILAPMAALARRCFANRCDDRALLADVVDGALTPGAADASYGDGDNTVNLAAGEFHSRYVVHKLRYIQHPINYLFGGFSGFVRRENVVFPTYFKDQPRLGKLRPKHIRFWSRKSDLG